MDATQAKILEQTIAVLRRDMMTQLAQMAEVLTGMVQAHQAFQQYVQEQLEDIRGREVPTSAQLPRDGKEI
jgi:hypothetical protein